MVLKKQIYHQKFVQLVKDHLVGEKSGKKIGIMSNTVAKDVETIRGLFNLV